MPTKLRKKKQKGSQNPLFFNGVIKLFANFAVKITGYDTKGDWYLSSQPTQKRFWTTTFN
jgi:hypothetical protein